MIKLPINGPPLNKVQDLKQKGLSQDEIAERLRSEGHNSQEISDAINQSEIKSGIEIPSPSEGQLQPSMMDQFSETEIEEEAPSPTGEGTNITIATEQPKIITQQIPIRTKTEPEEIEELVEAIIDERWQEMIGRAGDIALWKEKTKTDITSIKQEILRMEERFENLQKSILTEVKDYSKGISSINSEIKALEAVLQKIITPLTTNIKELDRITKKLKSK